MEENNKIKLFISYSHKDKEHCTELVKHLNMLEKANLVDSWEDGELLPGDNWDEVIKQNLNEADIVLFLLSIDFMNSNYIDQNEIQAAVEKHNKGEVVIVPIMLRKCFIKGTIFEKIQGLPVGMVPILSKDWHSKDDAFYDVLEGLERIIIDLKKRQENIKLAKDKEKTEKQRIESERRELERKEREINNIQLKELEGGEEQDKELIELDLEKACLYFAQQKWDKAFPILYKYRNRDLFNSLCQMYLGAIYESGDDVNVKADAVEAVKWYQKAAKTGNADAENLLGNMYFSGEGVEKNYEFALKWFQKSANQDNKYAQYNIGDMYEKGIGVKKDLVMASEFYQRAARQGHEEAQKACKRLGIKW